MLSLPVIFIFCMGVWVVSAQEPAQYRDVEIEEQGTARGYRAAGSDVYTFYNIPYATAPTGGDRFKGPLPAPSWNDVFEGVNRYIACPQHAGMINAQNVLVEDCLVANIYVPDTQETNLPVLVIIHGGAFQMGYGAVLEPISLVNNNNIIAVSFNYRVGIHGFLCLGNEDAPGNAGFKDQVALLRWVQKNISNFGGNPNDVTVSGCSAGGASVDLLIVSSLTEGLIHKAVPESGNSVGVFAVQFDPLQTAKDHALRLNFTNVDDIDALTEFYKSLSYEDILVDYFTSEEDSSVVFSGCLEKDVGQEMFLHEAPVDILLSGNYSKIPLFVGFTNLEGGIRYGEYESWRIQMAENFEDFLPADLEFETEEERQEIATQIKQFYFGYQETTNITLLPFLTYFTDVMFVTGMLRSVGLQVQAGNDEVYLYEYTFTRSDMQVAPGIQGADHCLQNFAVMDENESTLPTDYVQMKETLRQLWRNFIRTGNPTPPGWDSELPTWLPTGVDRSPHYSIGDTIALGDIPVPERIAFWDTIYSEHLRRPQQPNASTSAILSNAVLLLCSTFFVLTR